MTSQENINFVLTGDENYIMPLGVVMTSILKNLADNRKACFYLFTTNFSKSALDKIYEIKKIRECEIVNIPMEKYIHYFKDIDISKFKLSYVSLVCYYRLLMLKILPQSVKKCFYVDGDMIIDTDLSKIYDKMSADQIASVVVEAFAMNDRKNILSHLYKMKAFAKFQKEPLKYPYFNAGFLLLNIDMARKEHLFDKAMKFLNENPNPPLADQDTLNAIIGQQYTDKIEYLAPEYNVFCDLGINSVKWSKNAYYPVKLIEKSIKKPKIYHYAGGCKPWLNNENNHNSIWWKYCKLSPWKDIAKPQIQMNSWIVKFYLFNFLHILSYVCENHRNRQVFKIKFLKIFPLLKIKKKETRTDILLFGIIPLYIRKITHD